MFAIFDEDKFLIPYLNLNIGNNIIDLVIDEPSCRNCNLKKHASLPPTRFIKLLSDRNEQYSGSNQALKKSIRRLDTDGKQEMAITRHYENCMEYGFTQINLSLVN